MIWEFEVAGRPIDTPERRAGLAERLRQRVRLIADRTVQDQYFQSLVRDKLWSSLRPAALPPRPRWPAVRPGAARRAQDRPGTSAALELRQAQVLLATLVNHVALIFEEFETIGAKWSCPWVTLTWSDRKS